MLVAIAMRLLCARGEQERLEEEGMCDLRGKIRHDGEGISTRLRTARRACLVRGLCGDRRTQRVRLDRNVLASSNTCHNIGSCYSELQCPSLLLWVALSTYSIKSSLVFHKLGHNSIDAQT